ncbi:hypothetical protein B0H13DRAFT_1992635 [Mycena leptocephala]|nr:hypothetical protein B0H13DRAFT_1992635 [Mycena leptocephala]
MPDQPPPYSPRSNTQLQSPPNPQGVNSVCDGCDTVIAAAHPRVRCLICKDYDLCAVCALGECFTGEHTSVHSTAIFLTSGGRNRLPVISQTWIAYGANSHSTLDTRLQSHIVTHNGQICDVCEAGIPAAHPRVRCLTCPDYDICAVCALGDRFAGEHASAHSTVVFLKSGGRNQPPVISQTGISYAVNSPSTLNARLQSSPLLQHNLYHNCDSCRTVIAAPNPRVRCLICRDYDLCAVCALGERFAGDHTSEHPTTVFLRSGDKNRPSVACRTKISYWG